MSVTKAEIAEAKLREAIAEARAATSEAHAAKKDLEHALREAREVIQTEVRAEIAAVLKANMDAITTELPKRMHELYAHAEAQIDMLINLAFGLPGSTRDTGKPGTKRDIRPAMAAQFRKWIAEQLALNGVPAMVMLTEDEEAAIASLKDGGIRAVGIPVQEPRP